MGKAKTSPPSPPQTGVVPFRAYQRAGFRHPLRRLGYVWRRQGGKSYLLSNEALDWMMETPGVLTSIISAAIALGTEIIVKEAQSWRDHLAKLKAVAAANALKLETNADDIDFDGFCDLFEHSKLEAKLWHDRTTCSRTRVIAPNPNTAVGWTGHIIGDEFGRWPNCQEVLEAIEPFMESNPQFRLRLATTPPPDDKHYSYEMLLPPEGTEFTPNAAGNFYKSDYGLMIHRVDAWDAALAGVLMHHPDTGEKITPEQHRALAFDKTAWDRNYGLKFIAGGTAAVSLMAIGRAMALGKGTCVGANITEAVVE
ncbi:hypothetical protein [Geminisphaera colitermitum]|uniref:hypothetical protein n=1 Tax=Geminisphaera colitermitum TaxID=1148786 RepID=UPI000158CA8B|nr:hypothetical protein [Geminisphaera colitermitum]